LRRVKESNSLVNHELRDEALERLIMERLIERTDRLSNEALLAFIDGWRSLLEILSRSDLWLPKVSSEDREVVDRLVARIQGAQTRVLDE
jgi:hypothetical protein